MSVVSVVCCQVEVSATMHKLFYKIFIIIFYMFLALLCTSSGGQNCVIQHLVSSHTVDGRSVHREGHLQCVMIPDAE